jgi:hypothetical protein
MPNRGTDPETIEQALTRLENRIVDRYTDTRADGRQAAIAPRYSPASAAEKNPAEVVKTTRVRLHSPLQASAILAKLAGMDLSPENDD